MREAADPERLLEWYDRNARDLPWRIKPGGGAPDPYAIWLSEIMLQQTTVAAVRGYFVRFLELWPNVATLAAAEDAQVMGEWAGLGYYARARNLLKCARIVSEEHGGQFPSTYDDLLNLPGIGPYTAAAIAAIAYGHAETVVDGNVERVMARLFAVIEPLPTCKPDLKAHAARLTPDARPGDYAQAVMDLGATICTVKSPECGQCPWNRACFARTQGIEATLPKRLPKPQKPIRTGIAYLAYREDGAWLLERRPDKGLLGGMLGWPGSDWSDAPPDTLPPIVANWFDPGVEVRHTFTHFHLRMALRVARAAKPANPKQGTFLTPDEFRRTDLPTVMRKAFDIARTALDQHH